MPDAPVALKTSVQPDLARELIRFIKSQGPSVGDRLPSNRALAHRFEVTTSALRDALIRLQPLGLIKILPQSGAVLKSINFEALAGAFTDTLDSAMAEADPHLFHLLDARQLIEVECATLAAHRRRMEDLLPLRDALADLLRAAQPLDETSSVRDRRKHYEADMRFHLAISDLAENSVLTTILRSLLELLKPYLVQIPWSAKWKELTVNAHLELFDALRSGDAKSVRTRMIEHTGMARDSLLEKLWETPCTP